MKVNSNTILSRNIIIIALIQRRRKIKRRVREFWVHPIHSDRLLNGKFYTMHSKLLDFPKNFFTFYRMTITSFIPVEERLSVTIRYLATGASFNTLSFDYLMGASTIRNITKTTCEQIWNILQPLYMPIKQHDDWIKIADEFYSRTNFPNIIGAIDGKHIRMMQPEHSGSSYFNYKKFFSCVLMAWTDADYKFVYIDVGSYGTASDSEIFKTSEMGKRLSENRLNIPSGRYLPNYDDEHVYVSK
ncbi:uncharacterized protein [Atheta coriaria]|uniref:uncharacterized protein n=1 Tax=Dalotia coriaria TaxID=877792 RepID=UPI0031F44A63